MRFRPCIDIHNGKVKQIIGGSLKDEGDAASTNFTSAMDAEYYAGKYRRDGLAGGHVILLNGEDSPYYAATRDQALKALHAYPGGMQAGGGIHAGNAAFYLDAGASHIIVTSYVFRDGKIVYENLERLRQEAGRERIVLDMSCRKCDGKYYIVTDRWQKFTEEVLTARLLDSLSGYCSQFLVHGVDVEGKSGGMDQELIRILTAYEGIPVTYAGGIGSLSDLDRFRRMTGGQLDFTIGSALDLFGGNIPYETVKDAE